MKLFHVGAARIERPDIRHGRKYADFGQGFYLSDDETFSRRWARERNGCPVWLNTYLLETDGLAVKRFSANAEWLAYLLANRSRQPDALAGYDVVIGPIANDTIYDTWGIVTSGLLQSEQALALLRIGQTYRQVVLKTEKAASALTFVQAEQLPDTELAQYRQLVQQEEAAFQTEFARLLWSFDLEAPDTPETETE